MCSVHVKTFHNCCDSSRLKFSLAKPSLMSLSLGSEPTERWGTPFMVANRRAHRNQLTCFHTYIHANGKIRVFNPCWNLDHCYCYDLQYIELVTTSSAHSREGTLNFSKQQANAKTSEDILPHPTLSPVLKGMVTCPSDNLQMPQNPSSCLRFELTGCEMSFTVTF